MEFINLEASGALPDEVREQYGTGLRFWDNLKMGGTGSHKLLFVKGPQEVHTFDSATVDTMQSSFQYLQSAFLIRFNLSRKLAGWILRYADLHRIHLYGQIEEDYRKYFYCELHCSGPETFTFQMARSDTRHFYRFFSKGPLQARLVVSPEYQATLQ